MRLTANREGLLTAFQVAAGVVPQRSPRPILSSAKLEFNTATGAVLLATDLELGVRYAISGVVGSEPGAVVLPVSQVIAILREIPDETIEMSDTSGGVLLKGSSSRFELQVENPLEFPDVPGGDDELGHQIKAGHLTTMIRRTAFACAAENSRYALHSILAEFDEAKLRFVATDSKRLAIMPGPMEAMHGPTEGQWLIHPKALQLLGRVLLDPSEIVTIILRENEAIFRTPKLTVYTRLVEGRYPRYQDVIPGTIHYRVPLHIGQFHAVVRQSRIVTNEESRGVVFRFEDGVLTLESRASQLGQSEVRLPIGYSGEKIEVTYDPNLLAEALRILEPEEEITLEMEDTRRASLLRTRDEYMYLVMPLVRD